MLSFSSYRWSPIQVTLLISSYSFNTKQQQQGPLIRPHNLALRSCCFNKGRMYSW
uniref:Uncharacterized protein n=1 Tax=Rhizophora mucronata TaxID=61149 RepID=A0A2P2JJT3_RHIMU